jgi:hypothetical protein
MTKLFETSPKAPQVVRHKKVIFMDRVCKLYVKKRLFPLHEIHDLSDTIDQQPKKNIKIEK